MAGSHFLPDPQDAKRAVLEVKECAGKATDALNAMLGELDEVEGSADLVQEVKIRIGRLIAQVDRLSSMVQSAEGRDAAADIAQSFNNTI